MQRFFFFLKIYAVYSGSVDFYRGIENLLQGTEGEANVPDSWSQGTLEHPNVP